jgi:hypothetical protein
MWLGWAEKKACSSLSLLNRRETLRPRGGSKRGFQGLMKEVQAMKRLINYKKSSPD